MKSRHRPATSGSRELRVVRPDERIAAAKPVGRPLPANLWRHRIAPVLLPWLALGLAGVVGVCVWLGLLQALVD